MSENSGFWGTRSSQNNSTLFKISIAQTIITVVALQLRLLRCPASRNLDCPEGLFPKTSIVNSRYRTPSSF